MVVVVRVELDVHRLNHNQTASACRLLVLELHFLTISHHSNARPCYHAEEDYYKTYYSSYDGLYQPHCQCASSLSGFFMASRFLARGQALGAVFNQLVRNCAQLLVAKKLFVPSEQAKKPVIEIPTVKLKEEGLLVGARSFSRNTTRVTKSSVEN